MDAEVAMACFEVGTRIGLSGGEAVSLTDVRGTTLRIRRGTVWLTQEHDRADVVLRAGDNWVVERDGRTVMEAQSPSLVYVVGRAVAPPRGGALLARTAAWRERLARWFPLVPRQPLPYV
jgi:hypothetical protein